MLAMGWGHSDLVRVSGESSSVVSQWLGKSSKTIKSIGSIRAALNIERASGYSALWVSRGEGPKRTLDVASRWPFEIVRRQQIDKLTATERGVVESAMLDALAKLDAATGKRRAANE